MKAAIALCFIGDNITGNPSEADGFVRFDENGATRELAFKRGNPSTPNPDSDPKKPTLLFPPPVFPASVAVELCERNEGKDWKCDDAGDQADVDAFIAEKKAKAKAAAEKE